jgi:nicotinamide phosphoribosyltransferase
MDWLGHLVVCGPFCNVVFIDFEGREIFKDPITDDGTKKSATGLLAVFKNEHNGSYELHDRCNWETENKGELVTIYLDGKIQDKVTLNQIRERLK